MLAVAGLAAALFAVRERTPDLMLEVTRQTAVFAPEGGGPGPAEAEFSFFLREAEADAAVEIIGGDEDVVRELASDVDLAAGEKLTLSWDGRNGAGLPAPPDIYRIRVRAPGLEREMIWPRRIALVRDGRPGSVIDELGGAGG